MIRCSIFALLFAIAVAGGAQESSTTVLLKPKTAAKALPEAPAKAPFKPDASLLPLAFAGWEAAPAKPVTDAALADAANAAALREYGFTDALLLSYSREGETLPIKALRFTDASGAYGAYSYYRKSGWPREEIGSGATSDRNRVLFWQGNVLVDATFAHISAMSGSELRELAAAIPIPSGNKSLYPPLLGDLPQKDLDGQTTHYALGPAGYSGSGGVLPPEMVGFDRGAETVTATYRLLSNPATLTIINYPTPQIAAAEEKTIAAYLKAGNTAQHPFTTALNESNPAALEVRRSGPLVAVVSGDAIPDAAHRLLVGVHYEAEMASVPVPVSSNVKQAYNLFVGIISLIVVMFVAALMLALFLGGGRALWRFSHGRPMSTVYDEEFIKLDLE